MVLGPCPCPWELRGTSNVRLLGPVEQPGAWPWVLTEVPAHQQRRLLRDLVMPAKNNRQALTRTRTRPPQEETRWKKLGAGVRPRPSSLLARWLKFGPSAVPNWLSRALGPGFWSWSGRPLALHFPRGASRGLSPSPLLSPVSSLQSAGAASLIPHLPTLAALLPKLGKSPEAQEGGGGEESRTPGGGPQKAGAPVICTEKKSGNVDGRTTHPYPNQW